MSPFVAVQIFYILLLCFRLCDVNEKYLKVIEHPFVKASGLLCSAGGREAVYRSSQEK